MNTKIQQQLSQLEQQLSQLLCELKRIQKDFEPDEVKNNSLCSTNNAPGAKRKRERKAARDGASYEDLLLCLAHALATKQNKFLKSRLCFSLVFLYGTGLRVSNLLELRGNHLESLKKNNYRHLTLPLIKSRKRVASVVVLLPSARQLLTKNKCWTEDLLSGKKGGDFVITANKCSSGLSREILTRLINKSLKPAGKKHHKLLTSHSFRIGYITSAIQAGGIELARELANHSSISTTSLYNRRALKEDEFEDLLLKMEQQV